MRNKIGRILIYSTLVLGWFDEWMGMRAFCLSVALVVLYIYMYNNLHMGLWILWRV